MRLRTLEPFPFCITPSEDVGAGTLHPFATTRAKCFEWFWRVKNWLVTVELTYYTFSFPITVFGFNNVEATTERDLICWGSDPNIFDAGIRAFGFEDLGSGGGIGYVEWELIWFSKFGQYTLPTPGAGAPDNPFETDALRRIDDAYYPQFLFRLRSEFGGLLSTFNDDDTTVDAGSLLTVDTQSIGCYTGASSEVSAITWEPGEYWEYRREDETEPIYDIDTGEVLPGMTPHTLLR